MAETKKESHHFISPWLGSQESRGYHACQVLCSLIIEETLSYFFSSHLIAYSWINGLICQLPVRLAAKSANKKGFCWILVITWVPLPGVMPPHSRAGVRFRGWIQLVFPIVVEGFCLCGANEEITNLGLMKHFHFMVLAFTWLLDAVSRHAARGKHKWISPSLWYHCKEHIQ